MPQATAALAQWAGGSDADYTAGEVVQTANAKTYVCTLRVDRPSEDVDLFTTSAAEGRFPEALATVIAAYETDGLDVSLNRQPLTPSAGG